MEIRYNDSWVTLCDTTWTAEDAKVICRMLGSVEPSVRPLTASHFGESTGNVLMVIILIHLQIFNFRFLFAPQHERFFFLLLLSFFFFSDFVCVQGGVNGIIQYRFSFAKTVTFLLRLDKSQGQNIPPTSSHK